MHRSSPDARLAWRTGWARDRTWLLPLLLLFAAKGVFLALLFAPFTGHDEVDHFFYIQRLAEGHGLGRFGAVMLPDAAAPYQKLVADFPYNAEVIQPPLYHLLAVPIYMAAPGGLLSKLLILRFVSVGIGVVALSLTWAISSSLFPDELGVRAGATAFVALQPQFSFEAAIVNHDILVITLAGLIVWLAIVWSRTGLTIRRSLWLGGVLGLGMLTKVSFGLMIPVVLVIVAVFGRRHGSSWRVLGRSSVVLFLTGFVLASPWFVRSLILYGDPTGAQQLRTIPGYGAQAEPLWTMLSSQSFWRGRLEDFWGNFGWRLIPFDPGTYTLIYLAWFVAGIGLVVASIGAMASYVRSRPNARMSDTGNALIVMGAWALMMIAGVLYIGTIQFTQSRFAFPGIAAFGILTALGYTSVIPPRLRWIVGPIMVTALLVLNVVATIRFVGPYYAGAGGAPGILP